MQKAEAKTLEEKEAEIAELKDSMQQYQKQMGEQK